MFEKKDVKALEKQARKEKKKERTGFLKIILVPLLITAVLTSAIYLVMDKMTDRESFKKGVVVAAADLTENSFIEPDDVEKYFKTISVDGDAVAESAFTTLSDLKGTGFYLTVPVKSGQIIYAGDIKRTDARLDKYRSGYEITGFSVSNFEKGVNGRIREGAVIDIYAVDPATDELKLYAKDMYVAAAYDSSGNELKTAEGVATSYTVYIKAADIENMNKAINYGGIHIYRH